MIPSKSSVTIFCLVAWKQDVVLSPHGKSSAKMHTNVVVESIDSLNYISLVTLHDLQHTV